MKEPEKKESENNSPNPETVETILYQEYKIGEDKTIRLFNTSSPSRLPVETYEEFSIRRKFNKMVEKGKLKGHQWWDSRRWGNYTVKKHEELMIENLKTK